MSKVLKPGMRVKRVYRVSPGDNITEGKIYQVFKLSASEYHVFYILDDIGNERPSLLNTPYRVLWEIVEEEEFVPDREYEDLYE